jgi:chorismate synthase
VFNPPPGLGNFTSWGDKLDGNIARAIMSIQTVIGIEIGVGFPGSRLLGSQFHDTIVKKKKGILRTTNNAGGIEGGMTNGETIIIRVGCKPIPTLKNPIESFNIKTKKIAPAHYERSDICVLPALSVIGESVVAFEIARAFLAKFGADTFCEVKERFSSYKKKLKGLFYI